MNTLLQDLRYGARVLWKTPGFTIVAVLTLALGIGANAAIFTVINSVLLKPLPVHNPQELVTIGDANRVNGVSSGSPQLTIFSYPLYRELLANNEAFQSMYATGRLGHAEVDLGENGQSSPESVRGRVVSGGFFKVLGVGAAAGRTFTAQDDTAPGADPFVVISYAYWFRRFNRDSSVVGKTIRVNNYPLTIIGVAEPGFFGDIVGQQTDLWVPMMMQEQVMPGCKWLDDASVSWLLIMGRAKPSISLDQAGASVNVELKRIADSSFSSRFADPEDRRILRESKMAVASGARGFSPLRAQFTRPLLILMAIVGFVLLIACVNVANLLLARSAARRKEIAVRLAIGAGALRIVRQLLTESVLLAFLGGIAGMVLAAWGTRLLVRVVTGATTTMPIDVAPDFRVFAFMAMVCLLTGILFGCVPAMKIRKVPVSLALQEGARDSGSGGSPSRWTAGRLLVVAQVSLSVIVLFATGLLVRSLRNLHEVDTGYSRERLVIVTIDDAAAEYKPEEMNNAFESLSQRLQAVPGVVGVGYSDNGLFAGSESSTAIQVPGSPADKGRGEISNYDTVSSNYFGVVGIPVLRGRALGPQDTATSVKVTVVNESLARYYFGEPEAALGRTITYLNAPQSDINFLIVGVSRNAHDHELRGAPERRFYVAASQTFSSSREVNFEVRVNAPPASFEETLHKAVKEFNPNLSVIKIAGLDELIDDSLSDQIVVAQLSTFFAGLALLLACVGLYGITSYSVAGRTREIGVRMALGARRADVLWMIMREALLMVVAGIAIGIPAAIAASQLLRTMLFAVPTVDPISAVLAATVLVVVAATAGFVPARRATRVDPMLALRYE